MDYSSLSGWKIAEKLGIHYDGDSNPLNGGYFYNLDDWQRGFTNVVRFMSFDGKIFVETGCVNIADFEVIEEYCRECGEDITNPHVQVHASYIAKGVESDAVNAFSQYDPNEEKKIWQETEDKLKMLSSG